jgi:hypothetical protein
MARSTLLPVWMFAAMKDACTTPLFSPQCDCAPNSANGRQRNPPVHILTQPTGNMVACAQLLDYSAWIGACGWKARNAKAKLTS